MRSFLFPGKGAGHVSQSPLPQARGGPPVWKILFFAGLRGWCRGTIRVFTSAGSWGTWTPSAWLRLPKTAPIPRQNTPTNIPQSNLSIQQKGRPYSGPAFDCLQCFTCRGNLPTIQFCIRSIASRARALTVVDSRRLFRNRLTGAWSSSRPESGSMERAAPMLPRAQQARPLAWAS